MLKKYDVLLAIHLLYIIFQNLVLFMGHEVCLVHSCFQIYSYITHNYENSTTLCTPVFNTYCYMTLNRVNKDNVSIKVVSTDFAIFLFSCEQNVNHYNILKLLTNIKYTLITKQERPINPLPYVFML